MKNLLKQKPIEIDLRLPKLGFLMNKYTRNKSYTERKSKQVDKIASSDNSMTSVIKKRYEGERVNSRKDKTVIKYIKKHGDSPKKSSRKIDQQINRNASRSEFLKNYIKFQQKKQKSILFKNSTMQKKKQVVKVSDLLQYNQNKYCVLPNIKIPQLNKKFVKKQNKQFKVKQKQTIPCKYQNIAEIRELDFLRLFILEQLIYMLANSSNYKRQEMISFCRIYLQNSEKGMYISISNIFVKKQIIKEALILQKLAVYVIMLLCTEQEIPKDTINLVKSISTYVHKNNLIILDLLMIIGENENIQVTSQFHIFNTMRFNESRRKVSYKNDAIELVKQNNTTIKSLLNIVTKTSRFESLSGFLNEIIQGQLIFDQQMDEVLFVLFSFQQVLMQTQLETYPQPQAPFLPQTNRPYTLVLDLDETLIHTKQIDGSPHFLIRPYCNDFLKILSQFYQIVIFTAGVKSYADTILDTIDKQNYITHRLYRHHTRVQDYVSIKDLSLIGRDLSKTIIIDNIPSNFKLQPRNGIYIATWTGNEQDCCLLNLIPVLQLIVKKQSKDVRDSLQTISKHMQQMIGDNKQVDLDVLKLQ